MNTNMKKVIRHILYFNGMAEAFDNSDDFHLRVQNPPFLPLVIERHGDEVSITHYIEQNGNLLRDPAMVFSLRDWEQLSGGLLRGWVPKSTEPGGFGCVYPTGEIARFGDDEQQLHYYPRQMKEALHFATLWAKNLREQGFVQRYSAGRIKSLTHAQALARALAAKDVPVKITHHVAQCSDGGEIHSYTFPDDLPSKLVRSAFRQAEERLKEDWPNWGEFGFGVTGQGVELHARRLPACTCG